MSQLWSNEITFWVYWIKIDFLLELRSFFLNIYIARFIHLLPKTGNVYISRDT